MRTIEFYERIIQLQATLSSDDIDLLVEVVKLYDKVRFEMYGPADKISSVQDIVQRTLTFHNVGAWELIKQFLLDVMESPIELLIRFETLVEELSIEMESFFERELIKEKFLSTAQG